MPKSTNQKDKIVKSALKLFARNGYASTPVSQIARNARVSQGLMYNFFKSKDDLLKAMMEKGFEDIRESMEDYTTETDPRKAIALHVRKTCQIIRQHHQFWRLLHTVRLQGKVAGVMQNSFREIVTAIAATFTVVFRKLGYKKPELESLLFLAQIDGMVMLFLQDENIPLEALAEQLINRYQK